MDAEKASKLVDKFSRDVELFKKRSADVGDNNPKDTPQLRAKLNDLRRTIGRTQEQLQGALGSAATDRSWDDVRQRFRTLSKDYEAADAGVRKREKAFPLSASAEGGAVTPAASASRTGTAGGTIDLSQMRRYDMNELATEEVLQQEKCRAAVEIEQEARELHSAYVEFNALTQEQQQGLDKMTSNLVKTERSMEKGIGQLQAASEHQKSSRKKLCILLVILAVAIAIIVIVVIVLKK
jgi:t-SNARE complex subunit (syntaxin)